MNFSFILALVILEKEHFLSSRKHSQNVLSALNNLHDELKMMNATKQRKYPFVGSCVFCK